MLPFRGISWLRAFLLGMTFMFFVAPIEAIAAMKEEGGTTQIAQQVENLQKEVQLRLDSQEKLVQSKVDQVSAISLNLENGRKAVDWWLSAITVFLGILSLVAVFLPFLNQRRQDEKFREEVERIREIFSRIESFERDTRQEIRNGLGDLRDAKREIGEHLRTTEKAAVRSTALSHKIEQLTKTSFKSKLPGELSAAAETLKREAPDSPTAKLLAKAMQSAEAGQWFDAVACLKALTDIEPEEESHWYNLGYMYSKLMSAKSQDSIGNWQRACDAYAEAVRLKPDDPAGWNGWGVALDSWGKNLPDAEATAKFADADAKFAEAVRLRPYDHVVWCNWGHSLGRWATALPDAERPAKLAAADANYAEAVRLKPDDQEAWLYWGKTLAVWAQILPLAERPAKFAAADAKFAEAVRLRPDDHLSWCPWGLILISWALTLPEAERPAKFAAADAKFAEAVRLRPDWHEPWDHWGDALSLWAMTLPKAERRAKLAAAEAKYAEAVRLKPDDHSAWYNWGCTLSAWAAALPEPERAAKLAAADTKYAEAVRLRPDFNEAWSAWGNTLIDWAKILPDAERPTKFAEAYCRLMASEKLVPGSSSYDLARVASLSQDFEEARSWLTKAREAGNPAANDIDRLRFETDLDGLRRLPWFDDFLVRANDN